MSTTHWLVNPYMLINEVNFVPSFDATYNENMNAITRCALVLAAVAIVSSSRSFFIMSIITIVVVVLFHTLVYVVGNRGGPKKIEMFQDAGEGGDKPSEEAEADKTGTGKKAKKKDEDEKETGVENDGGTGVKDDGGTGVKDEGEKGAEDEGETGTGSEGDGDDATAKLTRESFVALQVGDARTSLSRVLATEFEKGNRKNPFANVLLTQIHDTPDRKAAPPSFNVDVDRDITKYIKRSVQMMNPGIFNTNKQLFGDLWERFQLDQSSRVFYSMPNTRVCDDSGAFAQYLYNNFKYSSKEDTEEGAIARVQDAYRYTLY